jgi:hypothetical protein
MAKLPRSVVRALAVLLTSLFVPSALWGHGIEGDRMFIEPISAEDANIKNELVLPRAEFLTMPDGSYRSFGAALEKSLYPGRWSVVVEQGTISRHEPGGTVTGFDGLEIGTKVAVYRNAAHEFVLTPALFATLPTGSRKVADREVELHPQIIFAKGLGDLKPGWLRPFALQGDAGFEFSATGEPDRHATYDLVLMYSIPYLNHFVREADAGFDVEHTLRLGYSPRAILGDMFPFVELNGSTPVNGTDGETATFLRPGTVYMGNYFQVTVAADIPLTGYLPERRVGGVVQLDFFLDEIAPAFGWTPFGKRRHHLHAD